MAKEYDGLDDLLGGMEDDFNFDMEEIDDSRSVIPKTIRDTGRGFKESFTMDPLSTAGQIADGAIPRGVRNEYNVIKEGASEIKELYNKNIGDIKTGGKKTIDLLKNHTPEGSIFRRFFDRVSKALGDDEYVSENREPTEDERIAASLEAVFDKNRKIETTNAVMAEIKEQNKFATNIQVLTNVLGGIKETNIFNEQVAENYYRKSLELQYKSLFTHRQQLEVTKTGFDLFKTQFESIVKNTAMPDIVKIKTSEQFMETIQSRFRESVTDVLYSDVNPLTRLKNNVVHNISKMADGIRNGINTTADTLDQASMLEDMNKFELLGGQMGDFVKNYTADTIGVKLEKNEKFRKLMHKFKLSAMDPRESLYKFADEQFKKGTTTGNVLSKVSKFVAGITEADRMNFDRFQEFDPEEVTTFDFRTKNSITKIIPNLLSKIYQEVKTIRTGEEQSNVYYDYTTGKLQEDDHLVKQLKEDTRISLEGSVGGNLDGLIKLLANNDERFKGEVTEELKGALLAHLIRDGSMSTKALKSDEFLELLDPKFRDLIVNSVSDMERRSEDNLFLIDEYNSNMHGIKGNLPSMKAQISEHFKSGKIDVLESMGLVDYDPIHKNYRLNREKYVDIVRDAVKENDIIKSKRDIEDRDKELLKNIKENGINMSKWDNIDIDNRADKRNPKWRTNLDESTYKKYFPKVERWRTTEDEKAWLGKRVDDIKHYMGRAQDFADKHNVDEKFSNAFNTSKNIWSGVKNYTQILDEKTGASKSIKNKLYEMNDKLGISEKYKEIKEIVEENPYYKAATGLSKELMIYSLSVGDNILHSAIMKYEESGLKEKGITLKQYLEDNNIPLDKDAFKAAMESKWTKAVNMTSKEAEELKTETKKKVFKFGKDAINTATTKITDVASTTKKKIDAFADMTPEEQVEYTLNQIDSISTRAGDTSKEFKTALFEKFGVDVEKMKELTPKDLEDVRKLATLAKEKTIKKAGKLKTNVKTKLDNFKDESTAYEKEVTDETDVVMEVKNDDSKLSKTKAFFTSVLGSFNSVKEEALEKINKKSDNTTDIKDESKSKTKEEEKIEVSKIETIATTIAEKISNLKNKEDKKVLGDNDGDGKRDMGWFSRLKSKKKSNEGESSKEKIENVKPNGPGGILGGIFTILGVAGSAIGGILSVVTTFGSILGTIASGILSIVPGIGGLLKNILGPVLGAIPGALGVGGKVLGTFGSVVKNTAIGAAFVGKKIFNTARNVGNFIFNPISTTKHAMSSVGKRIKGMTNKIKSGVRKLKYIVIKRLGRRGATKIIAKITAKAGGFLLPGVGLGLLAYDGYQLTKYLDEGKSFLSALSLTFLGFDLTNEDEPIVDENDVPIKPEDDSLDKIIEKKETEINASSEDIKKLKEEFRKEPLTVNVKNRGSGDGNEHNTHYSKDEETKYLNTLKVSDPEKYKRALKYIKLMGPIHKKEMKSTLALKDYKIKNASAENPKMRSVEKYNSNGITYEKYGSKVSTTKKARDELKEEFKDLPTLHSVGYEDYMDKLEKEDSDKYKRAVVYSELRRRDDIRKLRRKKMDKKFKNNDTMIASRMTNEKNIRKTSNEITRKTNDGVLISGSGDSDILKSGTFKTTDSNKDIMTMLDEVSVKTGVEANTLKTFAALESGFKTNAKAKTSSATGLFQFTDSTWRDVLRWYGDKHGLDSKTNRKDPMANALMAAEHIKANSKDLSSVVPNVGPVEQYLAHFLGKNGAKKFLKLKGNDIVAVKFPKQAYANRNMFFNRDGLPLTADEFYNNVSNKLQKQARSFGYTGDIVAVNNRPIPTTPYNTPTIIRTAVNTQKGNSVKSNMEETPMAPMASKTISEETTPRAMITRANVVQAEPSIVRPVHTVQATPTATPMAKIDVKNIDIQNPHSVLVHSYMKQAQAAETLLNIETILLKTNNVKKENIEKEVKQPTNQVRKQFPNPVVDLSRKRYIDNRSSGNMFI